ncbi:uncharacterized protein LOC112573606 isoform X2 [Pomacea canaliculata]|uniref:uncharacterized protein LOC112573606 isoform X2 n=1 Tax=Pomacea canaliculata TaxID=400727 RepID=UPI000D72C20A|nr:uncharacterized protein LOC112573606 isoform X2 [Pomacea canaliculata]
MRTTRSRSRSFGALRPSSKKDTNALDAKLYENQQSLTEVIAVQEELLNTDVIISGKQSKKQKLVLDQTNTSIMQKTPLRRSSRLVARAETESIDEQNGATNEKESTPLLRLHRSHRSSVPKTFIDSNVDTSHMETHATPIGKRRQSKRLLAAAVESPISSVMKELTGEDTPSKLVAATIGDTQMSTPQCSNTEMEMNEEKDKGCSPGYENDGMKSPYQLRRRRSTSFLTPGPPLSSVKRSKAKRRRTDIMIALASAKSPEEAIKIIATSPMVEMTRRTPKSKLSPELIRNTTAALFDDDNVLLQGPLQLFPDPVDEQKPSCSSKENSKDKEHEDACVPEKRDVSFFRALWATEVEQLTNLADKWEALGEEISGLCEEVQGEIRSTVCQARLLMKQKLQQFSGLVDSCESGDPRTTCQDLQGFWDMVYMQVEDVDNKFVAWTNSSKTTGNQRKWLLSKARMQQKEKKTARVTKASGKSTSKFAAFKAQHLKQNKSTNADAEIAEEKVFDAGFFKVSSPVRTPRYHCEAGTPTKVELPILQSTCGKSSQELTPSSKQTDRLSGASENKENVAHIFLRRSMGEGHPRRSFSPSVPSPLLKDSTPRRKSVESSGKRLRRSLYQRRSQAEDKSSEKDESSEDSLKSQVGDEGRALSVQNRRSTRTCKSVSFAESRAHRVSQ